MCVLYVCLLERKRIEGCVVYKCEEVERMVIMVRSE